MAGELERLLIRLEADTAMLRRELLSAEKRVDAFAGNADRNLAKAERRFQNFSAVGSRALSGLAVGYLAKETGQLADTYAQLENRLKFVTRSAGELEHVQQRLFGMAQSNRTDLSDTTELYARFAFALKDTGVSTNETLQFVDNLGKAMVVSGVSASEASGALQQLSQGLASGTLRGQELNSVMEQFPLVAQLIADQLGVTVGELRKMGEAGEITGKKVFDAVIKGTDQLKKAHDNTVPTVSQGFTNLNNSLLKFVGLMDQSTGASSAFARMLQSVSKEVEKLSNGTSFLAMPNAKPWGGFGENFKPGERNPANSIRDPQGLSQGVGRFAASGIGQASFDMRGEDRTSKGQEVGKWETTLTRERDVIRENMNLWREYNEETTSILFDAIESPALSAADKMMMLNDAVRGGVIGWHEYGQAVAGVTAETQAALGYTLDNVSSTLGAVFKQSKGVAIAQALINTYEGITKAMTLPPPFSYINAAITGAKGFAQVAAIRSTNAGRAAGGPVSRNMAYTVGERGPEVFVPNTAGRIVPNNEVGGGGGPRQQNVYHIDARGADIGVEEAINRALDRAERNRRDPADLISSQRRRFPTRDIAA